MIERNHLAILRAVAERGTLTGAADSLCLTQSALSHSMRKLEQQLGVELWAKDGRNLRFTQAGEYLLSVSQAILPQLESAEDILRGFGEGRRGKLRIGMECHPCYEWLLRVVTPFLAQWRDVELDVRQRFQFGGLNALRHHEIDALITPDPVEDPVLLFQPVFDYELRLIVARDHPLAGKCHVEPADLASQNLITYPVPKERLDIYTRFLLPAAVQPQGEQQIETTEVMLHLVAAGRGVTVMPGWLVPKYVDDLAISDLRLGGKGIHKQIFVGIRSTDRELNYLSNFIDLCRRLDGYSID